MAFLAGIHDMASVAKSVQGAAGSGYAGDWVGASANGVAAIGKTMWYLRNQIPKVKNTIKDIKPSATWIVDIAMVACQLTDFINGVWAPNRGEDFTTGSLQYENLYLQLVAANPDPRDWDGKAAQAYADANAALQGLAQAMQELDKQMQALVSKQGEDVQSAHTVIAVTVMSLVFAQGVALLLYLIPVEGAAISTAFQVAAALAAVVAVVIREDMTASASRSLAGEVDSVLAQYDEVAASATQLCDGVTATEMEKLTASLQSGVAAAKESRVASFAGISDSMSGISAMPDIATFVDQSVSAEQRQLIDALISGESPQADSPDEAPAASDGPAMAAFTMPTFTMDQVAAFSAQAAKLSGNVSQQMSLVNQTMGSVQSLASMGQGAAAPAQPAPAQPAPGEDPANAGAAVGAEGGERAPVDVPAVDAERGQEPSSAARVL